MNDSINLHSEGDLGKINTNVKKSNEEEIIINLEKKNKPQKKIKK